MKKQQVLVICQHGNERAPKEVLDKHFNGSFEVVLANKKAYEKNIRFIETDLNRSFPGDKNVSLEDKIASKLLKKLKKYQQVVDLHTATCDTPIFVIITKATKSHLNLTYKTGIKKIVFMEKSIASGKALIDHVPLGISIEAGDEHLLITKKRIKRFLNNLLNRTKKRNNLEYYSVFGLLKKESKNERLLPEIKHFRIVRKGNDITNQRKSEFDFYPILPRETNYKGVLCLMAKKVKEHDIIRV